MIGRLRYLRRVLAAYLGAGASQLTFWHETPEINAAMDTRRLGPYYMTFREKADYGGPRDGGGIPLLDYRGLIGRQYNPIAIAQYGLGNYNALWEAEWAGAKAEEPGGDGLRSAGAEGRRLRFLNVADWLLGNLEENAWGLRVWHHKFDWEYRDTLRAPWYSGLAQGHGISVLVRAAVMTGERRYMEGATAALEAFRRDVSEGGVRFTDEDGHEWYEEYVVSPPTHILNGFMWGSWGLWDYWLATKDVSAREMWESAVRTLAANLWRYDTGAWSLYEQSGTRMKMLASPFYHSLHITQLRVMHRITGMPVFAEYADRWAGYAEDKVKRFRALAYKSVFKLCYY